jgi:hypothetical protein
MELRNISIEDFITIFGKEGYDMLIPHDVHVLVVEEGMVPVFDAAGYEACVTGYDFEDGKGPVVALIINPTKIVSTLNMLEQADAGRRQRALQSFLVHERTHLIQHEEGRLTGTATQLFWEGEEVNLSADLTSYAATPWEVEAYAAQIAFIKGISIEEATALHLENIANNFQAA